MSVKAGAPILCLAHRVPFPPDKGDRIRSFHVLEYLSQRCAVHLACLADEPVGCEALDTLNRLCDRVAIAPLGAWSRWPRAFGSLLSGKTVSEGAFSSARLRAVLAEWTATTAYRSCLLSASSLAPYLRLPGVRDIPAIVDLVDVDSQKWLDYAAASCGPRAQLYRLEGERLRAVERRLARTAKALTLVSPAEVAIFREFCADGSVHAVPNGVDLDYFRPAKGVEEPACVFVGALDYKPNVDGIVWFCREAWPAIHGDRKEAKLYVVGRKPVPAVLALAEIPGVEMVGQVPDVRPWVARSAVAVVPLHIARGVQNKVLEAMAMAKAVVASPQALAGVRADVGTELLCAARPTEWAETVLRLFDDSIRRQQLGVAARGFVEANHRWDRCLEPLGPLLGL